eukprot:472254-Pyramimonas_sp.AAC.1
MTVLAKVCPDKNKSQLWALVKGSPEAVAKLLTAKPANYDATYRQMAENGASAYHPEDNNTVRMPLVAAPPS